MSKSTFGQNATLNVLRNTAYAAIATAYVQLHVGNPGAAGTANVAGNTTRQAVTFAAASGGSMASNGAATWTNVSTTETYSHISIWDAAAAGNCTDFGALTAPVAVTAGDTFTIASGSLTLTET